MQFCGALDVFADALVGPAKPEARAIKAAKRKSASANALCLDAPSVMGLPERTVFSSAAFMDNSLTDGAAPGNSPSAATTCC
jgi:hypothetical protein